MRIIATVSISKELEVDANSSIYEQIKKQLPKEGISERMNKKDWIIDNFDWINLNENSTSKS